MTIRKEAGRRPLYFTVVFWGAEHRRHFSELLLASLLAPRNIPALDRGRGSKFLIATTEQDWRGLQDDPLFRRLGEFVEPVWCHFEPPRRGELTMLAMSRGQAMMASRAFQDRAYGMYLAPDTIFSDGSIAALERLAEAGKKVVLAAAVRFQFEGAISELEREGYLRPGRPTAVGSRDLMRILLRHPHSEMRRYEYGSAWFADKPISPYWRVPGGDGIIIHNFSWAPLLVDYGALARHDVQTFAQWTLDGDYIHRNFPDPSDVYVVTDSDEVAYVSFTKESDRRLDLDPYLAGTPRWARDWYQTRLMRRLKDSEIMDPLKRAIFPIPVYFHAAEISPAWERTRRKVGRIIARVYRPAKLREEIVELGVSWYVRDLTSRYWVGLGDTPWSLLWCLRYRRYLGHLLKEKLGFAPGRRRWDDGWDWTSPAVGIMNPVWSIRFVSWFAWRYRRFLWRRVKEKIGLVHGRSRWDDRDWPTPTVGIMNPVYSVSVLAPWAWTYRRFLWQRLKEKIGVARGHSRWEGDQDWTAPVVGWLNPIWSLKVGLARLTGGPAPAHRTPEVRRVPSGDRSAGDARL